MCRGKTSGGEAGYENAQKERVDKGRQAAVWWRGVFGGGAGIGGTALWGGANFCAFAHGARGADVFVFSF